MQPDWEIWVDMHISPWIGEEWGWKAKSSYTLGLNGLDDIEVYSKAKAAGTVILLSKDSDFPAIIKQFGAPPKLIYLKIGNASNKYLWSILKPVLPKAIRILTASNVEQIEIE